MGFGVSAHDLELGSTTCRIVKDQLKKNGFNEKRSSSTERVKNIDMGTLLIKSMTKSFIPIYQE